LPELWHGRRRLPDAILFTRLSRHMARDNEEGAKMKEISDKDWASFKEIALSVIRDNNHLGLAFHVGCMISELDSQGGKE